MRDLVNFICAGLGIKESEVAIEEAAADEGVKSLTVSLPFAGIQALDGREHRTAKALRLVLSASAAAKNERLNLVARAKD